MIRLSESSSLQEENNQTAQSVNPTYVKYVIENELEWEDPAYALLASDLVNSMANDYSWNEILTAVMLWNDYSNAETPIIRKAGVYMAVTEYSIAQMMGKAEITQSYLAQKYGVSAGTISQRYSEFLECFITTEEGEDWEEEDLSSLQLSLENSMADFQKLLGDQNMLSLLAEDNVIKLPEGGNKLSKKDKAQDLIYDAWDEPSPKKRIRMANQALELYPDCADAYNLLAETAAGSYNEMADYYYKGMQAGERDLGKSFFRKHSGHFWGLFETRPYMRSKAGYAEALRLANKSREAIREYEQLLNLNPMDNQGIRYRLLTAYLEMNELDAAQSLVAKYPDEGMADFNYNIALLEYIENGITVNFVALLKQAKEQNAHVIDYLIGKLKLPDQTPEYIGFGDKNEAIVYVQHNLHLWNKHPRILRWIKEQFVTGASIQHLK